MVRFVIFMVCASILTACGNATTSNDPAAARLESEGVSGFAEPISPPLNQEFAETLRTDGPPPSALPPSTEQLLTEATRAAELIIVGTIRDVTGEWHHTGNGERIIFTNATVAVEDVWKGKWEGGALPIREWGGTVDDITQHFSFAPSFREGEHVVLFLVRRFDGRIWGTWKRHQGKLTLQEQLVKPLNLPLIYLRRVVKTLVEGSR